ncbi:MAG: carboxymuconolactone decarboxylase family protein [Alphaproteobacteria bacterium]|nr:carboxymuconolactone decarboxylase family protein [Alphaproteobacteria bacterium]
MQRIANLQPDQMNDDQKRVADAIAAGPRGGLAPLFQPWLRAPELADRAQRLGEYVRYRTSLGPRLSELAILAVARHWTAQLEWYSHEGPAREAGLSDDVIAALKSGAPLTFERDDERKLHDFVTELHNWRTVSQETYDEAIGAFGEVGVAELVCLVGYYTMAAMTLNVFQIDLPDGVEPPLE